MSVDRHARNAIGSNGMGKKKRRQIHQVSDCAPTTGQTQKSEEGQAPGGNLTSAADAAQRSSKPPQERSFTEKEIETATNKYKALYDYSTDILLKEHDRFNRADEKASKYSTIFVFLMGIFAYFEKWSFDRIVREPSSYVDVPVQWPVMVVGAMGLCLSGVGWFLANRVIMLRPYASRPLNQEMFDFYDKHTLLDIYDSCARRNKTAYEENTRSTNKKYAILTATHKIMSIALTFLTVLLVLFALYSLF
jgi:hypothetical protein